MVSDYSQMDRVLKEERDYILNLCKKIKKAGCNVLLVQKSILRCCTAHTAAAAHRTPAMRCRTWRCTS